MSTKIKSESNSSKTPISRRKELVITELIKLPFVLGFCLLSLLAIVAISGGYISIQFSPLGHYFLLAILFIFSYAVISYLYKFIQDTQITGLSARSSDDAVVSVIDALRQRSKRLRFTANVVLLLIWILLIMGFNTFTGAEESARSDTSSFLYLEELLESEVRSIEQLRITNDTLSLSLYGETNLEFLDERSQSDDVDETLRLTDALQKTEQDIARRQSYIGSLFDRIERLDQPQNQDSVAKFALSLLSTKIGAVLLLVFGTQILVSLYRYSSKLAAFSESRADMLQLYAIKDLDSTEDLVKLFDSTQLGFSNSHSTPSKQAIELTKELLGALRNVS